MTSCRCRSLVFFGLFATTVACADHHSADLRSRAAVRASYCAGESFGTEHAPMVLSPATSDPSACEALAPDCETYFECVGIDTLALCDPFDPTASRCDDAVAVTCSPLGFQQRTDCSSTMNPECRIDDIGPRCRSAGECVEGRSSCDGNTIVTCPGGLPFRHDCGGRSCVEADGRAACIDSTELCSDDFCDGNTVVRCVPDIGAHRYNCEEVSPGLVCAVHPDGVARCGSPTVECEDLDVRCEGDIARVCSRGTWIDFRCGDFGGGRCEAPSVRWRCVPPD